MMRAQPSSAMPNPNVSKRKAIALSRHLEKHLLAYTVAGAGLAIASVPADAQIIYTPSNILLTQPDSRQPAFTSFDINNDGVDDFKFAAQYGTTCSTSYARLPIGRSVCFGQRSLKIDPLQAGDAVIGKLQVTGLRNVTAQALPRGAQVGAPANFVSNGVYMARYNFFYLVSSSGTWVKTQTAYLGLKFVVSGEVHYGWARLKFAYPGDMLSGFPRTFGIFTGTISGYAYESTPNKSILTGQTNEAPKAAEDIGPTSLGLLATGARGLTYWRDQLRGNAAAEPK